MDPTLDVNERIRKEIWIESPHQQLHIDNYLMWVPAAAVYGLNIAGIKGKNNLLDRSMIYLMSSVISNAAVFGLKGVTHEQRPDGSDYYSFPSGHTAQAFVSAEFLRQEYKDVSPWYGIAGYGIATGVGILRMYNNKHWLNDVVAGAGFGIASTRLTYWLYPKIKNVFSKNKPLQTMMMPTYNQGSFGIAMVHFFK
ncbi:MAG: phosphatase PAP2 family protein [Bacteroidetes bacterium]|nr:phosphatase PAP2 family protein [Bacteroidota bacterium]